MAKGKQRAQSGDEPSNQTNGAGMDIDSDDAAEEQQHRRHHKRPADWDPDQDQEERRAIRKEYRQMLEDAENRRANINDVTASALAEAINASSSVFSRVKQPTEATMDSRFLIVSAETAAAKAKMFRIDRKAFNIDEFLTRVKKFGQGQAPAGGDEEEEDDSDGNGAEDRVMGEREKGKRRQEFWERLGWQAAQHSFRVPATDLILGPLNIEKKERKQAERKPRKTKAQLALEAPSEEEEVEQLNHEQIAQDDKATARMIMVTEKCLEEATALDEETGEAVGMNLFKFFINPDDFAQSVENLFYLSFLIKAGRALLDTDTGDCLVSACEPPNEETKQEFQAGGHDLKKQQLIFEFDMQIWRDAIDLYQITQSYIPHRDPNKAPATTQATARSR